MSTSSSSSPAKPLVVPRSSASLVVVNDRNEILLVHRNPKARSFGGMHVFPGGNHDKKQDDSLAVTAIRETFEESGLLLASANKSPSSRPLSDAQLDEARQHVHQQRLHFQAFLDANKLEADTDSLLPFTQWITPPGPPRYDVTHLGSPTKLMHQGYKPSRFHTQFFVTFLSAIPSAGFSFGTKQERLPQPDGGLEVISARFVHPTAALQEFHAGSITLMPPQFYILTTLSDILDGTRNTEEQREKVERLSRGAFGQMVMNPRPRKPQGRDQEEGYSILTYEGDETRGGSPGRLHRAKLRMVDGIIKDIILQRNFDIFSDIELCPYQAPSKL